MLEAQKENLRINKLISQKRTTITVEGDMIVPDSKPDILNTIGTSGVVSIYKKELQDGGISTFIMYIPDGVDDTVRGLSTNLDFTQTIDIEGCNPEMQVNLETSVKTIECKVLNGRKISIKASIEINIEVFSSEDIEVITDIQNTDDMQILKENLNVSSLVGCGKTRISVKDNISIDNIDNLAEILKVCVYLTDRDVKMSYNKVLTKAEAQVKIMYLTEDNRINCMEYKMPVVGFVDIPDVKEGDICDVNYEIKNIIIKPNPQEEHSIYVEIEIAVCCSVYEQKEINLIQDMYSPTQNINFMQKSIMTMSDKQEIRGNEQIREKISLDNIEGKKIIDVEISTTILNENKINTKILYEAEMNLRFTLQDSRNQLDMRENKIPFNYTVENIQNGEKLSTNNTIDVKDNNFIIQDDGTIMCNVDLETNTNMYRMTNINVIDSIEENGEREDENYSIVIYMVKEGDTLWQIAKKFGGTVEAISKINEIEDVNRIYPGQKLFIPRYVRNIVTSYE